MRVQAFDRSPITSKRQKTPEGYLLVPGLIAASDNVQPYLASELGIQGVPPTTVIRVYRPKEEVEKAAKSFDGVPVTLQHPSKFVNAKTYRTVNRGRAQNPRVVDAGIEADLLIQDEQAISKVESGELKELSCAYDFELTMQKGTSPHGQAYDAMASNMTGNHIAIVKQGRSRTPDGKPCHVADSDKGDRKMRVLVFDALLLGTATATTLPEMEDNAATAVDTIVRGLAQARDTAITERDAVLTEAAAKLEAQAVDHASKLKALEDSIPARVQAAAQDIASVLIGANGLGVTLKAEGKDAMTLRRELLTEVVKDPARKAVMDAMVPDVAKASDEALRLATSALFALPTGKQPAKAKDHSALSAAVSGKKDVKANDGSEKPVGRQASIEASANAWQRKRDK